MPERTNAAFSRLADSVGLLNRVLDRWVGLFERQVLAQELQAGAIDRMVSLQARRDLRAEGVWVWVREMVKMGMQKGTRRRKI